MYLYVFTFSNFFKRILNVSSIWTQKPGSKADIYTAAVLFLVGNRTLFQQKAKSRTKIVMRVKRADCPNCMLGEDLEGRSKNCCLCSPHLSFKFEFKLEAI